MDPETIYGMLSAMGMSDEIAVAATADYPAELTQLLSLGLLTSPVATQVSLNLLQLHAGDVSRVVDGMMRLGLASPLQSPGDDGGTAATAAAAAQDSHPPPLPPPPDDGGLMRALSETGRSLLQMAFSEEGNQTKRQELHPQSGEHQQVEEHFHRTCHRSEFQVTRICKVSHADREFRFYMAQKSMQRREGELGTATGGGRGGGGGGGGGGGAGTAQRLCDEVVLWHGTSAANVELILRDGFNRSFGAVEMFGHGVYFARDASYSANPRYASPDDRGKQTLILAKVLQGRSVRGHSSYQVPPEVPARERPAHAAPFRYDSLVDNVGDPSIVVSCHKDDTAVPAFVVEFQYLQQHPIGGFGFVFNNNLAPPPQLHGGGFSGFSFLGATAQPPQPSSGGFGFGATPQPPQPPGGGFSGFSFLGATAQPPQPPGGGFSFGGAAGSFGGYGGAAAAAPAPPPQPRFGGAAGAFGGLGGAAAAAPAPPPQPLAPVAATTTTTTTTTTPLVTQMVPASSTPAQSAFTRSAPAVGAGATSRYTGKQGTVVAVDHARQVVTVSFQLGQMSCSLDQIILCPTCNGQLMIQSGFFTIPCTSCNPNHIRSAVFSGGGGGGGGGHGPRRGL